jgi:hypothetical protein
MLSVEATVSAHHLISASVTLLTSFKGGTPPPFMPGNAGFLYAGELLARTAKWGYLSSRLTAVLVAYMAAGWQGSQGDAPGFPNDGSWVVKQEGMRRAI